MSRESIRLIAVLLLALITIEAIRWCRNKPTVEPLPPEGAHADELHR